MSGRPSPGDAEALEALAREVTACRACPRLVRWREQVARVRRRAYRSERYWGRPVPGFGDPRAWLLVVGLAPAAHGGNRTGRVFTGDRSGDVLFASLHRCRLAALPGSARAGDGQRLLHTRIVAAVRCAPPANKPTVAERDTCAPWLAAELGFVADGVRSIVCLGHFAWQVIWPQMAGAGFAVPRPRPAFGHGAEALVSRPGGGGHADGAAPSGQGSVLVIGCYHPSQQNTFTGRVTDAMLDEVFQRARRHAGL